MPLILLLPSRDDCQHVGARMGGDEKTMTMELKNPVPKPNPGGNKP